MSELQTPLYFHCLDYEYSICSFQIEIGLGLSAFRHSLCAVVFRVCLKGTESADAMRERENVGGFKGRSWTAPFEIFFRVMTAMAEYMGF